MEWKFKFVTLCVCCVVQCSAMSVSELEDFANFLKKTSKLDETLKTGNSFDSDEEDTPSDHAWEESGKFEGDLILNDRQRRMIVEDIAEGLSRNGLRDSTKRWPDNELIYYIQKDHFSEDQVQAINAGIEELARASCVKFRPYRKGDRDAVVVQGNRRGCFSHVGYQGGYQVLNLAGRHPVGRGCFRHGTVIHEFLHALGFYHMQSSPDRDDYVDIVWENIRQPARHNFRKYNAFSVSDFGVGYDYDSVLHYSRRAFSSNGQDTIVPKQVTITLCMPVTSRGGAEIGQRTGLSDKDTEKLNKMYCDANSNSEAEESSTRLPTKKKKPGNKPFQGQGIGYHQGKTVVIKLLPEKAQTYPLTSKPEFHLFDDFSKSPQILPETETEIHGARQSTVDSFKPYTREEFYTIPNIGKEDDKNSDAHHNTAYEIPKSIDKDEIENTNSKEDSLSKPAQDENADPPPTVTDELSDAFDRLSKIIRTHVYPSHTPDFNAYKSRAYQDYSHFGIPPSEEILDPKPVILKTKEENNVVQKAPEQLYEIIGPQITKEGEASYRTSYPFRSHKHISNGSLELKTPEYAKYENLKNKHDYSDLYLRNTNNQNGKVVKDHKLFGEYVPVYDDWYKNEEINHNPVDYSKNYKVAHQDKSASNSYVLQKPGNKHDYTGSNSPQLKQAYLLFGVPVPSTRNWFEVDRQKLNDNYPLHYYSPEKR